MICGNNKNASKITCYTVCSNMRYTAIKLLLLECSIRVFTLYISIDLLIDSIILYAFQCILNVLIECIYLAV